MGLNPDVYLLCLQMFVLISFSQLMYNFQVSLFVINLDFYLFMRCWNLFLVVLDNDFYNCHLQRIRFVVLCEFVIFLLQSIYIFFKINLILLYRSHYIYVKIRGIPYKQVQLSILNSYDLQTSVVQSMG